MIPDEAVHVEREGWLNWSWRAWGVLRRAQDRGQIMVLPTGTPTTVDSGFTYTRWGAQRRARRALRRWT